MKNNYLKLEFLSLPENQAFARDAVAAFCLPLNPTLDMLSDVKTAVSEAVTNCTVHAPPRAACYIYSSATGAQAYPT